MDRARRRPPLLRYASDTSPDRVITVSALIGVGLAGNALMIVLGLLAGSVVLQPAWLAAGGASACVIAAVGAIDVRRMNASSGRDVASPTRVVLELALWALTVGMVAHGLGSGVALMGVALLPVVIVAVVLGNAAAAGVVVSACIAVLVIEANLEPTVVQPVTRVLLVVVAGGITGALMTKLVAVASIAAVEEFGLLNEMGVIAAGAQSLESGLAELTPKAAALTGARRITACRIELPTTPADPATATVEVVHEWRAGRDPLTATADVPNAPDPPDEVLASPRGALAHPGRSWLWAPLPGGAILALACDGDRPRFRPQISWQYAFDRIVPEIEVLANQTSFIAQLAEMTLTDYLTGLANRRSLMERLAQEIAGVQRRHDHLMVAMIDLDHFKGFNDTHGHLVGDQLLRGFATLLASRARAADLAARYGGEEFCLVLPATDEPGATRLLDDLHRAARQLRSPMGITFSAGLAHWHPGDDPEALLARADAALYRAKATGRDRTELGSLDAHT